MSWLNNFYRILPKLPNLLLTILLALLLLLWPSSGCRNNSNKSSSWHPWNVFDEDRRDHRLENPPAEKSWSLNPAGIDLRQLASQISRPREMRVERSSQVSEESRRPLDKKRNWKLVLAKFACEPPRNPLAAPPFNDFLPRLRFRDYKCLWETRVSAASRSDNTLGTEGATWLSNSIFLRS